MSDTRSESDSIGPIDVPADAYWGAQTQRSVENFPFGATERMPIGIVHALAIVKRAAARVNAAKAILDLSFRAVELEDISTRLEALEEVNRELGG